MFLHKKRETLARPGSVSRRGVREKDILTVWLVQKEPLSSRHSALRLTISAFKGVQSYQCLPLFSLQELLL